MFLAAISSHVVVVDVLLTYSNLHFNDLLCSSLSWTVLLLHAHPSGRYLRPFIDRFFCRELLISDRDVACFNFRPWAFRFALPRCIVSFSLVAGCFPSWKYILDLTYCWPPWPVSLSPSGIRHVISAFTSSRLFTNYTQFQYVQFIFSLQFPITNTLTRIYVMVKKYHKTSTVAFRCL